jgi:glutamate-1-semialdehyde 2,1-aminomutase
VPPDPGFLEGLKEVCHANGALLIFDEVMTGFRLSPGGAQELFGVIPDLTTLGKIIGGGFPVGAYGGRKEIMDSISPTGPVYQAGTLSGNPIAMNAGYAQLKYLKEHPETYQELDNTTADICGGIQSNLEKLSLDFKINRMGSMFTLFFNVKEVRNFTDAKTSDMEAFGRYFNLMLEEGIYLAPSQYEALFISTAIDKSDIDHIVASNFKSLSKMYK